MRALRLGVALALLVAMTVPPAVGADVPGIKTSPPGQISVVTINARQYPILGIRRFRAMYQLSRALRRRPEAFDGGFNGAVHAPDVIVLQEIRPSNLEIFEHILRQRFGVKYVIVGPADAAAAILAHPETVSPVGEVLLLQDACSTPADDRYPQRQYPLARFIEQPSGASFAIVGVHFPKASVTQNADCLARNVDQFRTLFEVEQTPTIIAGDFNRRPVSTPFECDVDERSDPLPWYANLTAPDNGGRQYLDAVREFNRSHSTSMAFEWTHEHKAKKPDCTGNVFIRRSRIDYIFVADGKIADAHADHPGWGGEVPGSRRPGNFKYSDHRWVSARVVLSGPRKPIAPVVAADAGGLIRVSWEPVNAASQYILYRALGERAFGVAGKLPAETTAFEDLGTQHGRTYRYAVAAVGADGGQGVESFGNSAIADSLGPQVVGTDPLKGAIGVGPGKAISVRFNEGITDESVGEGAIRLYVDGHTVRGFAFRKFPRLLRFNPNDPLKEGRLYTAVVAYGLEDRLGNESERFAFSFRTVDPPKRRGRRR